MHVTDNQPSRYLLYEHSWLSNKCQQILGYVIYLFILNISLSIAVFTIYLPVIFYGCFVFGRDIYVSII